MMTIYTNAGHQAVIDFSNFAEAEKYATEHDMEVHLFVRTYGSDRWEDRGEAFSEIAPREWNWDECSEFYNSGDEYRANHTEEFADEMEQEAWNQHIDEIAKEIDRQIAYYDNGFAVVKEDAVEALPTKAMRVICDNDTYEIGCVKMF